MDDAAHQKAKEVVAMVAQREREVQERANTNDIGDARA
jgi:hypothetical protein